MLDKKTEMMLSVATLLTAEDLDQLRATAPMQESAGPDLDPPPEENEVAVSAQNVDAVPATSLGGISQGERERLRTRESKIATQCVGAERPMHDWWSIGTELIGRMGSEVFTATVVENLRVKSGRSLKITSGAADGTICRTPTRAALEATEAYRQANNLGRGGGVTNGWEFWKPRV
ncbi:MAG: hypothetical protein AMXMBFR13_06130 [Phycisphaerae bacterium]